MQRSIMNSFTRIVLILTVSALSSLAPDKPESASGRYIVRENHSRDGIGKLYMGREIAHVMGHLAADWLERPERQQEENTDLMVQLLGIKKGQVVADIGAGTGYISKRLSTLVGDTGKVLAVDIQPE